MLTQKRQEEIVKLVQERGSITLQEMLEMFQTSESTIRRDITSLDKAGRLIKVFGGAVANNDQVSHLELSVSQKKEVDMEEKRQIAKYAASLVAPDDFVYIDAGTTTGQMLEYLTEKRATYVTNAVVHARGLVKKGFEVILIGGTLKGATEAVVGAEAVAQLKKYHFSKGFFGTNGIHPLCGFTTPDINEALLKEAAVKNTQSRGRFVLSASSKFGRISSVTFAGFDGVEILTDKRPEDIVWKKVDITEV
ncbi:MAG: DeoR/GlpR family DNA-binding transcription regulator [Hespellia sp.]|nr:DeoR/GlpR family DNA-binding transcription regulator [Hespellia sp.]